MIVDRATAGRLLEGWLATPWSPRRNCWWLAAVAARELYGRDVPLRPFAGALPSRGDRDALFASHPERARWRAVPAPVDGAIVLMSRSALGDEHAGIFLAIGRGVVLHTDRPHDAVLDPLTTVASLRGWRMTFHVPLEP